MKSHINKIVLIIFFIFSFSSLAQEIVITGTVVDFDGPLPDVSVFVKGTTTGTATDFEGYYSIKANKGDVLVFSHVLYQTKEITISEETTIDLILKEEAEIISCYFGPNKWINFHYLRNLNYKLNGVKVALTLHDYYAKKSLYIKTGYLTDFKNNSELSLSLGTNTIINDDYIRLNLAYEKIKINTIFFKREAFNLESSMNFYFSTFKRGSSVSLGLGLSSLNDLAWKPGIGVGLNHNIANGLNIYNTIYYWVDYWQINQGLNWNYKDFKFTVAHQKIKKYSAYSMSIGYNFYF